MLSILADSIFAIGESHADNSLRYLKQIKIRAKEKVYDTDNVCLCHINKPYNFLQFEFLNFSTEHEHLKQLSDKDKEQRISEVLEMKQQGISNVEIARRFGVSEGAVRKWIKKSEGEQSK
jgi:DNA-directed RNA polymerase specialized sigma24 family protein